jgi:hypothetical protein
MKRFALVLSVLAAVAGTVPATAQTPHATPTSAAMSRKIPATNLANPANRSTNPHVMSGQGCISGPTATRAQLAVNPITGKAQAAPIVVIPLSKGAGSVANATTRAQQAQACAHPH